MMNDIFGTFITPSFTDCYPNIEEFINDYTNVGLPVTITEESARILYYLLYAYYGNSIVASTDLNRFKYNLFSIIWQYGPTWEKRVEIQRKVRQLTDEEIFTGSKQIANHAYNPQTAPSTASLFELEYIDQQNTISWKKNKLEGYSNLMMLLDTDVSDEFLRKFRPLFRKVLVPDTRAIFFEQGEDEQ